MCENASKENGNQNQNQATFRYVGSPYNFVPLADKIIENYSSKSELPAHNRACEDKLSGRITFQLKAETPVFVGGGNGKTFYCTVSGKHAIPGSTVKGLVRNNMQILSRGSIADDVEDYQIKFRAVGNVASRRTEYYKKILGADRVPLPVNVKAGYICYKDGEYFIKETVKETVAIKRNVILNYYILSEKTILEDETNFKLERSRLMNKSFDSMGEATVNDEYYPYYTEVYYSAREGKVTSVYEVGLLPNSELPENYKKGYLISSGPMDKKKNVYIIPEASTAKKDCQKIEGRSVLAYKRDYEKKKNSLHGTRLKDEEKKALAREFFQLPEPKEGKECKPVFYFRTDYTTYFGFTPYLRVFYKHSTLDGLSEAQKDKSVLDYARSILGFSEGQDSYRSRVSFEDAPLIEDKGEGPMVQLVLSEPKLSSYLDYLNQEGSEEEVTYNDEGFSFRGIKQYWLHEDAEPGIKTTDETDDHNDNVISKFTPLNEGSCFKETIRFKNLRKEELGLLLWCIYQGNQYQWNIGKAKPYGYGRMEVSRPVVKLYDMGKMYDSGLTLDVYRDGEDIDEYICAYQSELKKKLASQDNQVIENVKEVSGIKEFLAMKDSTRMPMKDKIQYMSVDDGGYQNRDRALPSVDEVLNGKEDKEDEESV